MILYDSGDYHFNFVWNRKGSLIPRGIIFSMPSAIMAGLWRLLMDTHTEWFTFLEGYQFSMFWSLSTFILGVLVAFRTNRAYSRFWEGITLVQMMRAEWFEACSNLMAFSKHPLSKQPNDKDLHVRVMTFQAILVRLMSLMHGAALRQIGGEVDEFEVIDVHGLDRESLTYLAASSDRDINIVEILLHWIQVMITDAISTDVMSIPPPVLTRAYQTLSRGMVNLHNAKKIADVPFPFPLSQIHVVLIWFHAIVTPIIVADFTHTFYTAAVFTMIPICGSWILLFISAQFEQPFGDDANDLPLSLMQHEFNASMLMLLDPESSRAPKLVESAATNVWDLRSRIGDPESTTDKEKMKLDRSSVIELENMAQMASSKVGRQPRHSVSKWSKGTGAPGATAGFYADHTKVLSLRRVSSRSVTPREAASHGLDVEVTETGKVLLRSNSGVSSNSSKDKAYQTSRSDPCYTVRVPQLTEVESAAPGKPDSGTHSEPTAAYASALREFTSKNDKRASWEDRGHDVCSKEEKNLRRVLMHDEKRKDDVYLKHRLAIHEEDRGDDVYSKEVDLKDLHNRANVSKQVRTHSTSDRFQNKIGVIELGEPSVRWPNGTEDRIIRIDDLQEDPLQADPDPPVELPEDLLIPEPPRENPSQGMLGEMDAMNARSLADAFDHDGAASKIRYGVLSPLCSSRPASFLLPPIMESDSEFCGHAVGSPDGSGARAFAVPVLKRKKSNRPHSPG